jgi:hypothetical protein
VRWRDPASSACPESSPHPFWLFLAADLAWFEAGRRVGDRILHLACGLSRDEAS